MKYVPVSWEEELARTQHSNSQVMPGPLSHVPGGFSTREGLLTRAQAFPLLCVF